MRRRDPKRWTSRAVVTLMTVAIAASPRADASDDDYEGRAFPDQPTDGGAVLPDLVVEAENQVRQDALKTVPVRDLTASDIDSVASVMDEEVLGMSPVSGLKPHLNNLVSLESDQMPHFWLPDMACDPVVTFHSDDWGSDDVTEWELTVVNFRGLPVRSFSGNDRPPAVLEWDGRDESGRMLDVGFPYSYRLRVDDRGSNTYHYNGASFRIHSLDYYDDGSRSVNLSGARLFEPGRAELTESGRDLLDKTTDVLRDHPLSAVTVSVVASRKSLGDARAKLARAHLAAALMIPEQEIALTVDVRPEAAVELDGMMAFEIHNAR